MHRVGISGGNAAKCGPRYGRVGIDYTSPGLRPLGCARRLVSYLGKQVRLASSHVTARHPNHEEAAALALASDAAVLVREDPMRTGETTRSTTPELSGPETPPG
jgi:hypothetical protein